MTIALATRNSHTVRSGVEIRPNFESPVPMLNAALSGDQQEWAKLVDRYTPFLARIAAGFRIGDEATDAVQTTFLQLLVCGAQIKNPEGLASWLRTTVRHECLRIIKRRSRIRVMDSDEMCGDSRALDETPVEDTVIRREQVAIVRGLLAGLPDHQRELIGLLSNPEGGSYLWVSEQLGIPVGSIGPTRQRILRRLRRSLEALQHDCWV